jgi:hypothetical protein
MLVVMSMSDDESCTSMTTYRNIGKFLLFCGVGILNRNGHDPFSHLLNFFSTHVNTGTQLC